MRIVLLLICLFHMALVSAQGINFTHDKWNDVLSKAKKENKLVFVDVYTTWCGPCKVMTKKIFPTKIVGNYFNEKFINVKIDAERGEGVKFAEKYDVNAYPSLLFIDANGKLVGKNIGAVLSGEALVKIAKKVVDNKDNLNYEEVKLTYEKNKSNFSAFSNYAEVLLAQGDAKLLNEIFTAFEPSFNNKQSASKEIFDFSSKYIDLIDVESSFFEHLSNRYNDYTSLVSKDSINNLITNIYTNPNSIGYAHKNKTIDEYIKRIQSDKNLSAKTKQYVIDLIHLNISNIDYKNALTLRGYGEGDKIQKIAAAYRDNIVQFVDKYIKDLKGTDIGKHANDLTGIHLNVKLSTKEKDNLLTTQWWENAIKYDKSPDFLYNYSAVLYGKSYELVYSGEKEQAKQYRKKAIALIEEAVQKIKADTTATDSNLDFYYELESYIKRPYELDAPPTLTRWKEVNDLVKEYYIDSTSYVASEYQMEEKLIKQLLTSLDPYSKFVPYSQLNQQSLYGEGVLGGIGMELDKVDDKIMVVGLTPKATAHKAGVKIGDLVTEVNGTNVANESISSIIQKIVGTLDAPISISVVRNGKKMSFSELKREPLKSSSVWASYMISSTVGYINLRFFGENAHSDVKEAIEALKQKGMTKLIFDLTNNPGGIKDQAIKIADEFIAGRKAIVKEADRFGETVYMSNPDVVGSFENGELIVLINENSASASELVSGCLQDHDRATFVGRKSFGKGVVQGTYILNDGNGVQMTISKFIFPSGRTPQIADYSNTKDNYRSTLIDSGQLTNSDNIDFSQLPVFKTTSGKKVYGNSGVMPDIFVPLSLPMEKETYKEIKKQQLILQYVINYLGKNQNLYQELQNSGKEKFIENYMIKNAFWQDFLAFLKQKNIDINSLKELSELLKNEIKAEIGRNIWNDNNIYVKINNSIKPEYKKAIMAIQR